jgi:hypothetical protein
MNREHPEHTTAGAALLSASRPRDLHQLYPVSAQHLP